MASRKPASKAHTVKSKTEPLTGKARRHLRSLGHSLDAVLHVGKTGISEAVLNELDQALSAHELVKVRLLRECPLGREQAAEDLAARSGAEHVQTVGNVLLLYRQRTEEPTIEVPGLVKPSAKAHARAKAKPQIHERAKGSLGQRAQRIHAAEGEPKTKGTKVGKPKLRDSAIAQRPRTRV